MPTLKTLTTTADLDKFSWQATCNWPDHSSVKVIHEGLDYGALTRYFLWDKVPRAIRQQVNPEGFAFEQALLDQRQQASVSRSSYPQWKQQIKQPFHALSRFASIANLRLSRYRCPAPVVFVPRQHSHLRSTLSALLENKTVQLVAPLAHGPNTGVQLFQTVPVRSPDLAFAEQLYQGIIYGLQAFDIQLLATDQQVLKRQIQQQARLVRQIEAELAIADPQAVLTFADNHAPLQEYVAIANRQGIPTIVLQHGLDCEQYCLNEAYASVIAVWGNARKQRYQASSQQQPARIQVTGNPEYDCVRLPEQLSTSREHWLWTTRPHGPQKCYSPSRTPQEGLDMLEAILTALERTETARLTIKPHPLDYIDLYSMQVEKYKLGDRVTISRDSLLTALPQADIVISEDSTAAMEAMFFGKVIVHAHFASSPPVLPLVDYAAALPASSPKILINSLQAAQTLSADEQKTMLNGQRSFVYDYAGPLDGQACQRVTDLITQVVSNAVC
ncbi:MAG: hypothetical protein WA885_22735 [Phormidesmis sp.]